MRNNKPLEKTYRINQISPKWEIFFSILLILMALIVVLPFLLVISISFTGAKTIVYDGYRFIPKEWSLEAYKAIGRMAASVGRSYMMTIFYTTVTTIVSLFIMSMLAYVLARKDFRHRRLLSFLIYFTTLFSGGMVPSYVLNTRYLHLNDTIWISILPFLVSAFDVIILRTFIQTTIPDSLFESAKLDGANDFQIYLHFVLPLSKAGLAAVGLFKVVERWNDWFTGLLYIENPKLVPIMTLLQKIQNSIDYLKTNSELSSSVEGMALLKSLPSESCRMAIAVLSVLPLLIMYPFFQKYFVEGLTLGSVKG